MQDFDGDGKLDIFHGVDYGPINTWYGDGSGNFVQGASVEDPATDMRFPRGFDAADLNGDKWLDLIGVDGAYMRAFLNPGDRSSSWTSAGPSTPVGDYPCCDSNWLLADVSPSAGDLDGNGVVDQVAFLGAPESEGPLDVLIFEGKTVGSSLKWTQSVLDILTKPGWAGHAGVADLDGDGYLDIHLSGSGNFYGLRAYLGDGRGNFTPEIVGLDHGVGGYNSFATGDLNGDKIVDIVTARHTDEDADSAGFEVLFGVRNRWSFLLPAILRS